MDEDQNKHLEFLSQVHGLQTRVEEVLVPLQARLSITDAAEKIPMEHATVVSVTEILYIQSQVVRLLLEENEEIKDRLGRLVNKIDAAYDADAQGS